MYARRPGMLISYHVHSTYSDGKKTIRELVEAAVAQGLDELGISDHYVLLPEGRSVSWSMSLDGLAQYLAELEEVAEEFRGRLVIRKGLEVDYDHATENGLAEVLRAHDFDFVIGSVHFIDGFPVDESPEHWDRLSESERNDMIRAYWARIELMARSRLFDFAGHLDLYKKFGHRPTIDVSRYVTAALDAIAASGMAVEINTAGWFLPACEAYPSLEILSACRSRGIPIIINSDAHEPSNLTRGFDRAYELARSVGYSEVLAYNRRAPRKVCIACQ
jgi:histidinol-phosphatase (PHP family)